MDQQTYVYFYSVTARSTNNDTIKTSGLLTAKGDFNPKQLIERVEKEARDNIGGITTIRSLSIDDIHSVEGPWSS